MAAAVEAAAAQAVVAVATAAAELQGDPEVGELEALAAATGVDAARAAAPKEQEARLVLAVERAGTKAGSKVGEAKVA